MHLSELSIIIEYLNTNVTGALISNVYRSFGGTLFKFFGSNTKGLYFNTREKVIFPVGDLSKYEKEPISRIEEGLRANFTGRVSKISLIQEYGKVVKIEMASKYLIIPLFGGRGISIFDSSGKMVWQEKKETPLTALAKPMKHISPETEEPLEFEKRFFFRIKEKKLVQQTALIDKRLKHLKKIKLKLELQLEDYNNKSREFFTEAGILKTNLYQIEGNSRKESIKIPDMSGEIVEIKLDPGRTVIENLQHFYKKAGKYKTGIDHTKNRLATVKQEMADIENGVFDKVPPETEKEGVVSSKINNRKHIPFHRYKSRTGKVFLVGKGAKDNDELTFKIASPHDMWFHAKDLSGSHVIMKLGKTENLSKEDKFNGSVLALYYSKAKKNLKGEVWITRRKNIVKKKGMSPGKVLVRKGDVEHVSADKLPENLQKIRSE